MAFFHDGMKMNDPSEPRCSFQQYLPAGSVRKRHDQLETFLDYSMSSRISRPYEPPKVSSYKPKYSPLMLIPDVKTRAREQNMRLQEQMERIYWRQTQHYFCSRLQAVDSVQSSVDGYDANGVWMFLAIGLIMGLVTGFPCFLLLCFQDKVRLRGGRINSFVTGAFIGVFVASLTISIAVLSAITRNGVCATMAAA